MSLPIGIIAEDISDVQVIDEVIKKIAGKKRFHIRYFIGYGSGKIKSKCSAWSKSLHQQNCAALILVHDLDEKRIDTLRRDLDNALAICPIAQNLVVIPVKELEAWLLADHEAIYKALNLKHLIKKIPNPETIPKPKEHLRDLIYMKSGKIRYYTNTLHNKKIAAQAQLKNLSRCSSFVPLHSFLKSLFT